ncbi:MAG: hypothetical protein WC516_05755 [Patescibacteria group bacterium]|jgi:hypothetical protein
MEKIYIQAKVQKIDKNIEDAIKKANIQYPHPTLRFFLAKYALVDGKTPNGNGIILEKSVQKDVPYLVGTQVNRNHEGDQRLGYILDAFMVGDEIQIVICFDSIYNENEYKEAVKLMDEGKLHVSFELMAEKSAIKKDGKVTRVNKVNFCGVGLLFDLAPAYKDGHVIQKAMKIIEDALNQEDKQLLYANVEDISKKWLYLGELIDKSLKSLKLEDNQDGGNNQMDEKAKKALLDTFKASLITEKGEEVKDWTDEQFETELIKRAEAEEKLKAEKEAADLKAKEELEKATIQKSKSTETRVYDVVEDTEKGIMEIVETSTFVREVEGKPVEETKTVRNTVYTQATLDAKITEAKEAIKAEYEAQIKEKDTLLASKNDEELKNQVSAKEVIIAEKELVIAEKDKEITSLTNQVAFYKDNAKKVAEIRVELGDFVKDLTDEQLIDENKITIARLQKQIEELKTANGTTEVTPAMIKAKKLETGHSEDNSVVNETSMKIYAKKATGQIK